MLPQPPESGAVVALWADAALRDTRAVVHALEHLGFRILLVRHPPSFVGGQLQLSAPAPPEGIVALIGLGVDSDAAFLRAAATLNTLESVVLCLPPHSPSAVGRLRTLALLGKSLAIESPPQLEGGLRIEPSHWTVHDLVRASAEEILWEMRRVAQWICNPADVDVTFREMGGLPPPEALQGLARGVPIKGVSQADSGRFFIEPRARARAEEEAALVLGDAAAAADADDDEAKFEMKDVSLIVADDVNAIEAALRAQPMETVILEGAPVDSDETPTVSKAASGALASALQTVARSMKRLVMKNHRFESTGCCSRVLRAVEGCRSLEELDLTNSSLGARGGAPLAAVLRSCPSLRILRVEDCLLGEEGLLEVVTALRGLAKLEEVDVRNNDMEADSALTLAFSLEGKGALRSVKLDDEDELEDAYKLVHAVLSAMGKEAALVLGDDDADDDEAKFEMKDVSLIVADDVNAIEAALRAQPMETVILEGAPVDFDETPTVSKAASGALASALQTVARSMKRLVMKNHRFESTGCCSRVLRAVEGCRSLEELDLTNSSLGARGGAPLAAVLRSCPSLRILRVEDCLLGEEGLLEVVTALRGLAKLEEVDARNNDMEADSALHPRLQS
ncbi:hypothetical protein AB1Y20_013665 [Prymnesium parvum]|uniref:Uncharacterized protein n=1 Tax=Prymnesium parvum TaxID=97485 RepID=A0AB34IIF2_PRYPA